MTAAHRPPTSRPSAAAARPGERPDPDEVLSPALIQLAHAHAVATEYWDWQGEHTTVARSTILAALAALDIDAADDDAVARSLVDVQERAWRRFLPDIVVCREGATHRVVVHLPHGNAVQVWIDLEDGGRRALDQEDRWVDPRLIDGALVGEATFRVPADLPLGWHTVQATHSGDTPTSGTSSSGGTAGRPLVVTPARLELPAAIAERRGWGFMTQLYSVRSELSWGLGDLSDLAELAAWSGRELGADFVLVNPMHAAEPVPPMEASPYLPSTRRFFNPIYLRVEEIREVAYLPSTERAVIEWQAEAMRSLNTDPGELDRDAVWEAKQAAFEVVFAAPRTAARQAAFEAFCAQEGLGLVHFATWCTLAERYGLPMTHWPVEAQDPRSLTVRQLREELIDRVEFFMWLQWCLDEQLARTQRLARQAGMRIGIVHDLAVGVHPAGADSWALAGSLASHVTVGAPPDAFNQQGQDWSQPPWRPDQLAAQGYAPYRDMLRTIFRHCGGLRVDHIIGLFRLWWVPSGCSAAQGTYVRYDHEALIGILALEAHRAGAFVIGEDLGTVEPWVRDYLRERGILGTSILWFEKDTDGRPLPPQAWRQLCLATVTTHDLPPTAGYLGGEHIELRERLGLLTRSLAEETAVDTAEREAVLGLLRKLGLLGERAGERETVDALHRMLTWTPAKLIGVALADAVGERRAMNQPGTNNEYPNWRLPLANGVGVPVLLDDLIESERVRDLAKTVSGS